MVVFISCYSFLHKSHGGATDCITPRQQWHFPHFCFNCFKFIKPLWAPRLHLMRSWAELVFPSCPFLLSSSVLTCSCPSSCVEVGKHPVHGWQRRSCCGAACGLVAPALFSFLSWLRCRALDQMAAVFIWTLALKPPWLLLGSERLIYYAEDAFFSSFFLMQRAGLAEVYY